MNKPTFKTVKFYQDKINQLQSELIRRERAGRKKIKDMERELDASLQRVVDQIRMFDDKIKEIKKSESPFQPQAPPCESQ